MKRWLWVPSLLCLLAPGCAEPAHETATWTALGDVAEAELYMRTAADLDLAVAELRRAVEEVESAISLDRPDSELNELNRRAGEEYYTVESRDLYRALLLALDYGKASRGAFDPTVGPLMRLYRDRARAPRPGEIEVALAGVGWDKVGIADEARALRFRVPRMQLDLGGVAKGFALDVASRVFTRAGSQAALLRIGGNFYAWNRPPGEQAWRVTLPDPRGGEKTFVVLRIENRGVAITAQGSLESGGAGRPKLILDPALGRPSAEDVLVAAAVADSAADADAMSTALFVAGSRKGGGLLERTRRVEAVLLVERQGGPELLVSASLKQRIEIPPELHEEVGGRVRYLLPPNGL